VALTVRLLLARVPEQALGREQQPHAIVPQQVADELFLSGQALPTFADFAFCKRE
jgi:hypothetical protein